MKTRYAIKSTLNSKFLTNLFEDKHDSTFTAKAVDAVCYTYGVKRIAEDIALSFTAAYGIKVIVVSVS